MILLFVLLVWHDACLHRKVFLFTGHCGDSCVDYNSNYLGWDAGGIGRQLVFMALQGALYLCVLALIESGALTTVWYVATQDR